jgi:tripartite-type tricarboxylate transporter receptor subunit TctC
MKKLPGLVLLLATLVAPHAARAQEDWPRTTIRFVVPYAPGGYTDAVGRIAARYVEKALGKPVVVDSRPGAGGILGTDFVAKSPPDGYTLCVCSVGAVSVAPVDQKVDYDPLKSLVPIGIVSTIPQTVIVTPSLPVKTIAELIAYAKANPGKLDYASSGAGGLMHFSVELFQARTGTKMQHVPYKGGAPATLAVMAGEAQLTFTNMTDALPQIEAGTVRALAVTSSERSPFLPDLPTVEEAGIPNYDVESWNGIMAPAGTPEPIIRRVAQVLTDMAADPEVQKSMANVGAKTVATTPEEFRRRVKNEIEQWSTLLKEIRGK